MLLGCYLLSCLVVGVLAIILGGPLKLLYASDKEVAWYAIKLVILWPIYLIPYLREPK